MGIELPNSGNVFLPEVPNKLRKESPELYAWGQDLRREITKVVQDLFSNDVVMSTAISLGTSGTFVISSGGSIIVTSGIVITVTS